MNIVGGIMIKKTMSVNGDSGNSASCKTVGKEHKSTVTSNTYKDIEIHKSVGKPSIPREEITRAVRSVMQEDRLLKH